MAENSELISVVGLNYRYASAWNEVNSRIAQRQNTVTIYVTLSTAIITFFLTGPSSGEAINRNLFSLFIPVVSLVFGFLNYKHDKTIALLRSFLAECEKVPYSGAKLVGYNSDTTYKDEANKFRNYHDLACTLLIVLYNIVGFYAAFHAFPDAFSITRWPIFFYIGSAIFSSWLVLSGWTRKKKS